MVIIMRTKVPECYEANIDDIRAVIEGLDR